MEPSGAGNRLRASCFLFTVETGNRNRGAVVDKAQRVVEDEAFGGRIRVGESSVEVFSRPGANVQLRDRTGRMLAAIGVLPYQTRILSLRGLQGGPFTVNLESLTGALSAVVEAP